jgi:hypothetical protein
VTTPPGERHRPPNRAPAHHRIAHVGHMRPPPAATCHLQYPPCCRLIPVFECSRARSIINLVQQDLPLVITSGRTRKNQLDKKTFPFLSKRLRNVRVALYRSGSNDEGQRGGDRDRRRRGRNGAILNLNLKPNSKSGYYGVIPNGKGWRARVYMKETKKSWDSIGT